MAIVPALTGRAITFRPSGPALTRQWFTCMTPLRFALLGAGFWARYQLAAWHELAGVECVAIYNRTKAKAEELANAFGVPSVSDDPQALLEREKLDFIDIVTDADSHARFVHMACQRRLPVICQKPMAPSLADAQNMVTRCRQSGTPFFVHENFRWQAPMRALKHYLDAGHIGTPFRARIDMISGFPVFKNQPALAELEQFILTDLGSHILDLARFFFGEAESLYCQTQRIHADIRGEDVATVVLRMNKGQTTVLCEMAYAENALERECFPESLVFIEGDKGSLELAPGFQIRLTTQRGTELRRFPPRVYDWCDPAYAVVQSSIVDCHRNLLSALRGESPAETTGEDNLRTIELVFESYESAQRNAVVQLGQNREPDLTTPRSGVGFR
jgi:D-apiose dehydrogenase